MLGHRPYDHAPTEGIQNNGQIEPAFVGRDVAEIGDPQPVRRPDGTGGKDP